MVDDPRDLAQELGGGLQRNRVSALMVTEEAREPLVAPCCVVAVVVTDAAVTPRPYGKGSFARWRVREYG